MKAGITQIKVATRIRKQSLNIAELAADIEKNGLLNPITVMPVGDRSPAGGRSPADGEYQLLAGLRRLRAVQSLGWTEIEVNVVTPKDAEAALNIEYSENVQREQFTFSEKMDYSRLIEEIERAKAKERMSQGGKGRLEEGMVERPYLAKGISRDAIGAKVGMSGSQYDRAKYITQNVPPEVIEELDAGERSIYGTYKELREAEENAPNPESPSQPAKADPPRIPDRTTFPKQPALPPEPAPPAAPVTDLQRAIRAERELDAMKYRQHNEIYHRDGIIENLKRRVADLEAALEAANARILELEEICREPEISARD